MSFISLKYILLHSFLDRLSSKDGMLPLGTQFSFVAVSVFLAVRNHLFVNHCYKQSLFS